MIVNIYIDRGKVINTQVDENTKHRLGDIIDFNKSKYKIVDTNEFTHYDYSVIIRINTVIDYIDKFKLDLSD